VAAGALTPGRAPLTLDARRVSIPARMSNPQLGPAAYQGRSLVVEIDHGLVVRLRPEAARRGLPVKSLIHDLLDVVGEEPGLVGAILDDGDRSSP